MGFNKFKHLPKSECCECIKEHLLPNRSCDDIRKQLNYFSSSEQRQTQLKELLRKQKQLMTNLMHNYEFVKDVHYKSPFEQAEMVQLPSQYTIIIERIKLAKVLKDTRKTLRELADKVDDTPLKPTDATQSQPNTPGTILSKQIQGVPVSNEISRQLKRIELPTRSPVIRKIRPPITKVTNQSKRQRSESPPAPTPTPPPQPERAQTPEEVEEVHVDPEPEAVTSDIEPCSPPQSPEAIVISSDSSSSEDNEPKSVNAKDVNKTPIIITGSNGPKANSIPVLTTSLPTSSILLPNANFLDLFSRPANLINPGFIRPIAQAIPMLQPLQFGARGMFQLPQQSPPVYLPSSFNGTVLIQPTIHIHTNSKNFNLSKYCQIKPKEAGKDYSNQSNVANNSAKKKKT